MKIAVLGISGMLGSTVFRLLSQDSRFKVVGSVRSAATCHFFDAPLRSNIVSGIDAENSDSLAVFLQRARPDVVINCIGVVKQLASAKDPLTAIPLNAILPHRLARLSDLVGARLIHVSTDCVFSGRKGNYTETDFPDAEDLYGRSKLLGEVDYPNAITLRTSIIGHELASRNGLVEWFLGEDGRVRGYTKAVFSGLTTDELTRVIIQHVLSHPQLHGTYHVSTRAIDKYHLLGILRDAYGVSTEIEPDDQVVIDRSLDASRFRQATGYSPPTWPEMIGRMREHHAVTKRSSH
jgi:dTDP-4-dehydrorhamnose reductase